MPGTSPDIKVCSDERSPDETCFLSRFGNHAAVMLLIDPVTGGIEEANDAAANFYGWPAEHLRLMHMNEIDAPSWARNESWMKELVTRQQGSFVSMHRNADDSLRYVEVSFGTVLLHQRTMLCCIIQDNSERQYFETLTRFRLRLLELADSASTEELLTFTLDEAERLTGSMLGFFNFVLEDQSVLRHACSTNAQSDNCGHAPHPTVINFGLSPDVISEKRAVIHNEYATLRHCNCKSSPHKKAFRELIIPVIRNGKVMATLEIGNKPVNYSENDIRLLSALTGVAWDIIAKKFAEESERKMQEAMQHTQKMELIGQLAGGIAHDINNALMSVLGHTELVLYEINADNPYANSLMTIRDSTIRAATLIQQLLGFARRQLVEPHILKLDTALEAELPRLRELVGETVELTWLPGANDAKILMDPSQLEQIVTNLCNNARDAISGRGSIAIRTSTLVVSTGDCYTDHPCQTPGHFVKISVIDSGCGIDKSVLPHIYEPFFTTKGVGKGSGLGLSTVYGIVKQNKGCLDCQSTPGKGTHFTIYLPLFNEKGDQAHRQIAEEYGCTDERKTVLLVNDDPSMIHFISSIVEKNGYRMVTAASPHEALNLLSPSLSSINLLLIDELLPDMNGRELSERLHDRFPEMKTLFMSDSAIEEPVQNEVPESRMKFISKPFRISDLANLLHSMLA